MPGYVTDTHSLLTMGFQHHPPYDVLAYIQVSTYPPYVPPAAYVYHPGLPPPPSHQSTSQYGYPKVYINFYHTDPSHTRHGPNVGIIRTYPIMPPPPHGYPLYQWPAYSGYPPQPCQLSCASSIAPAAQHKHGGNGEFSGRQGERGETS